MHRFQHLDAAGNLVYDPYPENEIPQLVSATYEEPKPDVTTGMGGLAGGFYEEPSEVEETGDMEMWKWNEEVERERVIMEQEQEEEEEEEEERNRMLERVERKRGRIRGVKLSPVPALTPTSIPTVTILTSWDPAAYTTESIPIPSIHTARALHLPPSNGPSSPSGMNPNQPPYTYYPPQHLQSMYYTHPTQQTTRPPHIGFMPIYTATTSPTPQNPYAQGNTTQYASSATSSNGGLNSPTNGFSSASYKSRSRSPKNEDPQALQKRLRNTAASARFRAKRKQREASLEGQSREKREALAKLERRVVELEEENKFLRDLVMEKGEASRRRGGKNDS